MFSFQLCRTTEEVNPISNGGVHSGDSGIVSDGYFPLKTQSINPLNLYELVMAGHYQGYYYFFVSH